MDENTILKKLQPIAQENLQEGKFYHDLAHALAVCNNIDLLLKYKKGDKLVLKTAALFHDICRDQEDHEVKASEKIIEILNSMPDFPKDKIAVVSKIIRVHDSSPETEEEKLFYDADKMDAFTELGIARSFMMYSGRGLSLQDACQKLLQLLDHFYTGLHHPIAKELSQNNYAKSRLFVQKTIEAYKNSSIGEESHG